MLSRESMPRLFRLIVVRRDRPETLRNILTAPDRPPGTGSMVMETSRIPVLAVSL